MDHPDPALTISSGEVIKCNIKILHSGYKYDQVSYLKYKAISASQSRLFSVLSVSELSSVEFPINNQNWEYVYRSLIKTRESVASAEVWTRPVRLGTLWPLWRFGLGLSWSPRRLVSQNVLYTQGNVCMWVLRGHVQDLYMSRLTLVDRISILHIQHSLSKEGDTPSF